MALSWFSDGRKRDSGSLMGSVSVFGAVAPTTMPSSRPTPDTVTATLGCDSLLQASLRITVLMTRSTGRVGRVGRHLCHLGHTSIGGPARPPPTQLSPRRGVVGLERLQCLSVALG